MKLLRPRLSTALLMSILAAGCSHFTLPQSDKVDYQSAGEIPPLEVPPDLVRPATDDRFAIPAGGTGTHNTLPYVSMTKGDDGTDKFSINDPFDRAWRRVGLALESSGITVVDRNRDKGIYNVRYTDNGDQDEKPGFFSKLFSSKKNANLQYQVLVKEVAVGSQVSIVDKNGNPDKSEAARHLLAKLYDQFK